MSLPLLVLLIGLGIPGAVPGLSQAEKDEGFVSLFNGRDLSGWHLEGPHDRAFVVADGELRTTKLGNYPTWLRTENSYENFCLRLDYKVPFSGKCDLVIHAPLHGRRSNVGIQIVISEETVRGAQVQHTGAIVGVAREKKVVAEKHSRWYPMEVFVDYPTLRVTVNGQVVQELDCDKNEKLRYRLRSGHIGLATASKLSALRNIHIKELPSKEQWVHLLAGIQGIDSKDKWVALESGSGKAGWRMLGKASWAVRDGVLRGMGNGYLLSEGQWQDFELFTYVRATTLANGGIFFRWKGTDMKDRGYEIQIYNNPDARNPTGSIYGYARNDNLNVPDNAWVPMQIVAKGKTVLTRINGDSGAYSDECTEFVRPGRIGLQMHGHGGRIEYKDLRVKPLD